MKSLSKKYILTVIFTSFILIWQGCEKSPINGDLDGQWQVVGITPDPGVNDIDSKLYYCFNLHTCMLTYYDGVLTLGNIHFSGNTLMIEFPNATLPETQHSILQYGIPSTFVTFEIDRLDKKSLVMHNDLYTVTLRKY